MLELILVRQEEPSKDGREEGPGSHSFLKYESHALSVQGSGCKGEGRQSPAQRVSGTDEVSRRHSLQKGSTGLKGNKGQ